MSKKRHWTPDEVREYCRQHTVAPLWTAGEWLGVCKSTAYGMAKRGDFPVPVFRGGRPWTVTTAAMLRHLGLSAASP